MKRSAKFMAFLLLSSMLLTGCGVMADTASVRSLESSLVVVDSSLASETSSMAEPVVSGSSSEKEDAGAVKNRLTRTPIQDDNNGEIYLGMSESEFLKVCERYDLEIIDSRGDYGIGAYLFYFSDSGQLEYVEIDDLVPDYPEGCETSRGLKVGDSVEKMIELYGDDYKEKDVGSKDYYYFFEGQLLKITVEDNKVYDWSYLFVPESPSIKEEFDPETYEWSPRSAN